MISQEVKEFGDMPMSAAMKLTYKELTIRYVKILRDKIDVETQLAKIKDDLELISWYETAVEQLREIKKREEDFTYYTRHGRFPE